MAAPTLPPEIWKHILSYCEPFPLFSFLTAYPCCTPLLPKLLLIKQAPHAVRPASEKACVSVLDFLLPLLSPTEEILQSVHYYAAKADSDYLLQWLLTTHWFMDKLFFSCPVPKPNTTEIEQHVAKITNLYNLLRGSFGQSSAAIRWYVQHRLPFVPSTQNLLSLVDFVTKHGLLPEFQQLKVYLSPKLGKTDSPPGFFAAVTEGHVELLDEIKKHYQLSSADIKRIIWESMENGEELQYDFSFKGLQWLLAHFSPTKSFSKELVRFWVSNSCADVGITELEWVRQVYPDFDLKSNMQKTVAYGSPEIWTYLHNLVGLTENDFEEFLEEDTHSRKKKRQLFLWIHEHSADFSEDWYHRTFLPTATSEWRLDDMTAEEAAAFVSFISNKKTDPGSPHAKRQRTQ